MPPPRLSHLGTTVAWHTPVTGRGHPFWPLQFSPRPEEGGMRGPNARSGKLTFRERKCFCPWREH